MRLFYEVTILGQCQAIWCMHGCVHGCAWVCMVCLGFGGMWIDVGGLLEEKI